MNRRHKPARYLAVLLLHATALLASPAASFAHGVGANPLAAREVDRYAGNANMPRGYYYPLPGDSDCPACALR